MNLKLSFILFLQTLSYQLGTPAQAGDSNVLKLSQNFTSNNYASPQLYIFGGKDESSKRQASASQFNSSTGEWDSINDMAVSKDAFCGAVIGKKIYLFGGGSDSGILKEAEVYDCETGIYSEFRALSRSSARYGCGAAALNGFIYVAGGYDGSKRLSSVIRYDVQTTRREIITPMHAVREGFHLIEFHGRIYAIGGWTNTVEVYDPNTSHWSEIASTHFSHFYFGATVYEGKIYVRSHLGFEVYSPEADHWETLTPLDDMQGTSLVSMNGKLWSLGGGTSGFKGTKSMFVYNTATNQWNKQFDMDVARMFPSSFVVNH